MKENRVAEKEGWATLLRPSKYSAPRGSAESTQGSWSVRRVHPLGRDRRRRCGRREPLIYIL